MKISRFSAALFASMLLACASCAEAAAVRKEPLALGYQLDISRCKVPTMETLFRIVDILAACGYNQFQLYTEHVFAYRGHESVWADHSPMTPQDVRLLDRYCRAKGIELVPNQNSFGHMENWLVHPEYNSLAEKPGAGLRLPWGYVTTEANALCPTDPGSLELVADLYDQLFPCFSSKKANAGCDETWEIIAGTDDCRSAKEVREKGGYRVYFDFLLKIQKLCAERGHTMMFWADILLHKPEMIRELPEDVIALIWGYEADHPFESQAKAMHDGGRRFYVCPGTSAWGSICGRVDNMMKNVDNAISAGEKYGMSGVLLADWGDGGTPQPFLAAVPAIVYTANRFRGVKLDEERLAKKIDELLGGNAGETLVGYGNLYLKIGKTCDNGTYIYRFNREGMDFVRPPEITDETIKTTFDAWRALKAARRLDGSPEWVKDEFEVMDLLLSVCEDRTKGFHKGLKAKYSPKYRELWLRFNRRGGMERSINWVFSDHKFH